MTRYEAFGLDRWADYLRALADRMELRDWTVKVSEYVPDDVYHLAEMDAHYGKKFATVSFRDDFFERTEEQQRETCVHELSHCHLSPQRHFLSEHLSGPAWDTYRLMEEYTVDGFTRTIAPSMPMPIAVKPRRKVSR